MRAGMKAGMKPAIVILPTGSEETQLEVHPTAAPVVPLASSDCWRGIRFRLSTECQKLDQLAR